MKWNQNECWEKGRDGVNLSGLLSIPVSSSGVLGKMGNGHACSIKVGEFLFQLSKYHYGIVCQPPTQQLIDE
jgi:hypothetical protein